MVEIPNSELTSKFIPADDADIQDIIEFAHTFDGYKAHGSFEGCAEIANIHRLDTLTNARTCLFFEARRWRHTGEGPDKRDMVYIVEILASIRSFIADAELA